MEALSQTDIDALMRALLPANGEELFQTKDNGVRTYDFRRPTKFKKDMLRTFVMVHDNFARLLQSFFLTSLRSKTQVTIRGTNQYLYAEYTQLLSNPAVVVSFRLNPLPGLCLMEISQNIAYAIVDRVFGGPGTDHQPQRGLTDIERGVITRAATDMVAPLQEAWRNVADVKPALEGLETNPMFLQTAAPSEVVATITLGVQIGEHMGHVALVFPYSTMEPIMSRLSAHSWLQTEHEGSEAETEALQERVQEAPVSVLVHLGSTKITVGEFSALQVGDVVPLGAQVTSDLPIYVGDSPMFYGRPGVVRDRMAVQITRPAQPGTKR